MHPNLAFIFFEYIYPTCLYKFLEFFNPLYVSTIRTPPPTPPTPPIIWFSRVLTNVEGCLISNTKKLYLISEKQLCQICQIMSAFIGFWTKKNTIALIANKVNCAPGYIPCQISPFSYIACEAALI